MLILGICSEHDSGAAIVQDGRILAAANEERFNRIKNYNGEPKESIRNIIDSIGFRPRDFDYVTLSKTSYGKGEMNFVAPAAGDRFMSILSGVSIARYLMGTEIGVKFLRLILNKKLHPVGTKKQYSYLRSMGIKAPIICIDHHLSHIASAYYTSGWDRCLAISLDAMGDGYCCRVAVCESGRIRIIKSIPAYHSPAYYYSYITHLLGFKEGRDEGKITGLAAYGDPLTTIDFFRKKISYSPLENSFVNKGKYFSAEIGALRRILINKKPEDIAAGIQQHLEDIVTALVRDALRKTQMDKIALSGGIFANVKLNQRIREMDNVKDVWIFPNMGDGGRAVGSALFFWAIQELKKKRIPRTMNLGKVFLGYDFNMQQIESELKRNNLIYKSVDNIEQVIADYLSKGKIVARFSGRMEYGPRALGNRSVLCQAKDERIISLLNNKLGRSKFMPFAPSILEEVAREYLNNYSDTFNSEFMTTTYYVTEKCIKEAPAIVHVDKTARPQIVKKDKNPLFYKIIKFYQEKTGLPLVLNTSFNIHEEPIVCNPQDAISTFVKTQLDVLAIGNFIVENVNPEKIS